MRSHDAKAPVHSKRKLPWTYWPIVLVALVIVMTLAFLIAAMIGLNAYVAATISGLAYSLYETWTVGRKGGA